MDTAPLDKILDEALGWREGLRRIGFSLDDVSLLTTRDEDFFHVAVQLQVEHAGKKRVVSLPCGKLHALPTVVSASRLLIPMEITDDDEIHAIVTRPLDLFDIQVRWERLKRNWDSATFDEAKAKIWENCLAGDPTSGWTLKIIEAGISLPVARS